MAYLYRQTFLLATENRKSFGSGIRHKSLGFWLGYRLAPVVSFTFTTIAQCEKSLPSTPSVTVSIATHKSPQFKF
jgi:hypothetical protein